LFWYIVPPPNFRKESLAGDIFVLVIFVFFDRLILSPGMTRSPNQQSTVCFFVLFLFLFA